MQVSLHFGVGVFDMPPIRNLWHNLLKRCYHPKTLERNPTYRVCTVCEEWLTLSNFWKWAEQHWKLGLCLDKDIIKPGNKVYCPEFCCFIPQALNVLLLHNNHIRGEWPIGDKKNSEQNVLLMGRVNILVTLKHLKKLMQST